MKELEKQRDILLKQLEDVNRQIEDGSRRILLRFSNGYKTVYQLHPKSQMHNLLICGWKKVTVKELQTLRDYIS